MSKTIKKIVIKRMLDEDPDLSFLEQDYRSAEVTEEENEKYQEQDRQRLANYGVTWDMLGIKAEAEIWIENGRYTPKMYQVMNVESMALWGIESDSGEEYFKEIEDAELEDVKATLKELGFTEEEINKVPIEHEEE